VTNKQAIEIGEELLEHSKKDIPYHKRKEGVTDALSHLLDLAKRYEQAKAEIDKEKLISVIVADQFDLSQPQDLQIINHFMVKAKRLADAICKADIIREEV